MAMPPIKQCRALLGPASAILPGHVISHDRALRCVAALKGSVGLLCPAAMSDMKG